jgi:REP element-mobilizing transposase RayT
MNPIQQDLPLPLWGGARRGAGRKRKSLRKNVPHVARRRFRRGALHVTVRMRREVWNLRTHRWFRAIKRALERGCERFGFRLVHFSVQGNHLHFIVEAPDAVALGRAMKGLEVRMARALNKVMSRRGPVFADRYHAHLLESPREAFQAVRYVLENWAVHAEREGEPQPGGCRPVLLGIPARRTAARGGSRMVDAPGGHRAGEEPQRSLTPSLAPVAGRSAASARCPQTSVVDTAASGGDSCASAFPSEGGGP